MKFIKSFFLIIILFNYKYTQNMEDTGITDYLRYIKNIKYNNNLIDACKKNDVNTFEFLIKGQNKKIFSKSKLLIYATKNNNNEMVKSLIKNNAEDQAGKNRKTALFYACKNRNKRIAKKLIEAATNIYDKENLQKYLDFSDNNGNAAIHIACEKGYIEIVELLIEKGANFNKYNDDGHTPFILAAKYQHEAVISLLKQKNVNISLKSIKDKKFENKIYAYINSFGEEKVKLISKEE